MPNTATDSTPLRELLEKNVAVTLGSPARRKLSAAKADGLLNINPWLL